MSKKPASSPETGQLNDPHNVRTDRLDSVQDAHNCSVQVEQSEESPLEKARRVVALIFFEEITRGNVSVRGLAHRFLGVDESIVRKYIDGRKPIPLAILLLLPYELSRRIVDRLFAERAATADISTAVLELSRLAADELRRTPFGTGKHLRMVTNLRKAAAIVLHAAEGLE